MTMAVKFPGFVALPVFFMLAGGAGAFETIVIDPGHGGSDEGTKWYHVSEKELTLDVARRLEKILYANHIQTVLTRHNDSYVSLDQRATIANLYPNSLLLSIHFNGSHLTEVSGFETYSFRESPSGRVVAESIRGEMARSLMSRNRGLHTNQDYAVLVRTTGCAVLVECGFISNRVEATRLSSDEGQQQLAEALARGIMRIKPLIDFDPPEAELAKCQIEARKHEEAERKLEVPAKKVEPPRKIASSTNKPKAKKKNGKKVST